MNYWTKEKILKQVGDLLRRRGRISEDIIRAVRGMPAPSTIYQQLGSYQKLYEALGYHQDVTDFLKAGQFERSMRLRRKVVNRLRDLFPQNVIVTHLPRMTRSMLLVDRSVIVSILLCRSKRKRGRLCWVIEPNERERNYITLLCTMNADHDRVLNYYVLPQMSAHTSLRRNDSWLREGIRLDRLSDFYSTVKKVWAKRSDHKTILKYLQEL